MDFDKKKKKGVALYFEILLRKFWLLTGLNMLYSVVFLPFFIAFAVFSFVRNYKVVLITALVALLVFSVFIGPATAGLNKVVRRFVLEKHSFIIRDFFDGFKKNFKKSLPVGLIDVFMAISVYASIQVYPVMAKNYSAFFYVPLVITLSLALVIVMMNYYIYPMMSATELSLKNLIKNSFALSFASMKTNIVITVICAVVAALMGIMFIYTPPLFMLLLPFIPSAVLWFTICFNSYPVIQKYVINPYYDSIGEVNPELLGYSADIPENNSAENISDGEKSTEKPSDRHKKSRKSNGRVIT